MFLNLVAILLYLLYVFLNLVTMLLLVSKGVELAIAVWVADSVLWCNELL